MQTVHPDEPMIRKMTQDLKDNPNSREPMKKIYKMCDVLYNTNGDLNKGDFRVARAPRFAKDPDDYTHCPNCKGPFVAAEFRKHYVLCTGQSSKDCRNLAQIGRELITFCSPHASEILKKRIFGPMRHDAITKAIKYDTLTVAYGNSIVKHLRAQHDKGNIVTQLRRLGRLKIALNVKQLTEIFDMDSEKVVDAIEHLENPGGEKNSEFIKHPTVARNFNTLVKAVSKRYVVMCMKNRHYNILSDVEKWIICFDSDYKSNLSKAAAESRGYQRRRQDPELPSTEDIQKLRNHLCEMCRENYNILQYKFDETAYKKLLKATVILLQIYNRKRPGDIEKVYLEDFEKLQDLSSVAEEKYNLLNGNLKQVSDEFSIMKIRGKKQNDLSILVSMKLKECIRLLIQFRPEMNISKFNKHLFALPPTAKSQIRYPSAYVLLRRFSTECGAEKPHLLRATKLRKHMATSCIQLNLSDAELNDLAGFMGHHIDVHKKFYRQNLLGRDIPLFVKFANTAMGIDDDVQMKAISTLNNNENMEPEENSAQSMEITSGKNE